MSDSPDTPSKSHLAAPGRLAELLVKHGLVSAKQVEAAGALQSGESPNLTKALIDLGFITDHAITTFLVKQLKIPHLNLQDYQINADTLKLLPQDLCTRYRVIPIDVLGKNLTVAMVNPLDEAATAAIQAACPGYRLKSFVCSFSEFELVSRRLFAQAPASQRDSSEVSLESLGISRGPAPRTKAAPTPPLPPPPSVDDAAATMLFDSVAAKPRRSSGPLRSSLICLDGWELGREIELTGSEHTLGRSPDADTTVSSPLISREHVRITRNEEYGQETFVITDLGSSNGTYVNNIPVSSTILRHGDRILLGNVLFKFVLLDEIEARFHKDVHHLYSIHKDTGLLPADAWTRELERTLSGSAADTLSACLIEIDNLPAINQTRGHIAGVIVMSDLGDLLERYLEKHELPGDMGDGRIGVTFPGKPLESVYPRLEDLRRTVEAHVFHHKEDSFRATISVGLAAAAPGSHGEALITALRAALDDAARQGRNTVAVHHA
jgi:two-component system cell cycle response regulator